MESLLSTKLKWMNEYRRFHFWLNKNREEHTIMQSEDFLAFSNVIPIAIDMWKNASPSEKIPKDDIACKLENRKCKNADRVIEYTLRKMKKENVNMERNEVVYLLMKGWLEHSFDFPRNS